MRTKIDHAFKIQPVAAGAVLVVGAALCAVAARSRLFPVSYLIVLAAFSLVMTVVVALLTRSSGRSGAFWTGVALAAVYIAAAVAICVLLIRTEDVLRSATAPGNEGRIAIYVSADDSAQTLDATAG